MPEQEWLREIRAGIVGYEKPCNELTEVEAKGLYKLVDDGHSDKNLWGGLRKCVAEIDELSRVNKYFRDLDDVGRVALRRAEADNARLREALQQIADILNSRNVKATLIRDKAKRAHEAARAALTGDGS